MAVRRRLSYDASAPGSTEAPGAQRRCPARVRAQRNPAPDIRPFRALRFDPEVVGDLGPVVAPPYDVIGPDLERSLLARSPHSAVRLDLPHGEPGEDPDERYRRVARTFAAWRSDGTLRKDRRAGYYVYEQAYRVPGTGSSGRSAATSLACASSRSDPTAACCPTSARWPDRARTATGSCERPG